jgi:hypothetical protein
MARTIRSAHCIGTIFLQRHHAAIGELNAESAASQSRKPLKTGSSSFSRITHVTLSALIVLLLIVIM